MNILAVEDDPLVLEYVESVLLDAGHQVVTAAGYESALEAAESFPDLELLVTDFNLGDDGDGVDLAETLAENRPRMRVLVVTAEPVSAHQKLDGRFGCNVLSKPFFGAGLMSGVAQALR